MPSCLPQDIPEAGSGNIFGLWLPRSIDPNLYKYELLMSLSLWLSKIHVKILLEKKEVFQ